MIPGECNFEEESTRGPTEEKNEPEEEITIKKLITTRKPTTKHPTEKPTTKQATTKQPTTKHPITPPPKQTSNQSNLTTPISTPLFPGQGELAPQLDTQTEKELAMSSMNNKHPVTAS